MLPGRLKQRSQYNDCVLRSQKKAIVTNMLTIINIYTKNRIKMHEHLLKLHISYTSTTKKGRKTSSTSQVLFHFDKNYEQKDTKN